MHVACAVKWVDQRIAADLQPNCPFCREQWPAKGYVKAVDWTKQALVDAERQAVVGGGYDGPFGPPDEDDDDDDDDFFDDDLNDPDWMP